MLCSIVLFTHANFEDVFSFKTVLFRTSVHKKVERMFRSFNFNLEVGLYTEDSVSKYN